MASDAITDVELQAVHSSGIFDDSQRIDPFANITEEDIDTECGLVRVAVHGNRKRRALFTYHDLGTTYQTCFRGLFAEPGMRTLLENLCVYHINAPGHLPESVAFSSSGSGNGQLYPSMEELAKTIGRVAKHYEVKHFVGLGVGVGANLFCRFHLLQPDMTDALILVNASVAQAGWIEWSWFKLHNLTFNRADQFQTVAEYLQWYWFGVPSDRPHDVVQTYTLALQSMKRENVTGLVTSFLNRSDVRISRDNGGITIKCPSLLITGDSSPHIDAVVETNSRLDPTLNNFLKLADCGGMILDEVPAKVSESLRLFFQGLGFFPALRGAPVQESASYDSQTTVLKKYSAVSSSYSTATDAI